MTYAVKSIDEIPDNAQDLFDLIFTRLNEQKAFGFDYWSDNCFYRTDDDDCCAVGILMPDDVAENLFDRNLNDAPIMQILTSFIGAGSPRAVKAWGEKVQVHIKLLQWCQEFHDDMATKRNPDEFDRHLREIGAEFGINTDKVRGLDWSWAYEGREP